MPSVHCVSELIARRCCRKAVINNYSYFPSLLILIGTIFMAAKPTILVHLAAALSLVDVGSIRSRGITPVHVARIYASTA